MESQNIYVAARVDRRWVEMLRSLSMPASRQLHYAVFKFSI